MRRVAQTIPFGDGGAKDLGGLIREARNLAELTQGQLANRVNYSLSTIQRLEGGTQARLNTLLLRRVADELGVSASAREHWMQVACVGLRRAGAPSGPDPSGPEHSQLGDADPEPAALSDWVRRVLVSSGLSEKQFAGNARIDVKTLQRIVSGARARVRLTTAHGLADAGGLDGLPRRKFVAVATGLHFPSRPGAGAGGLVGRDGDFQAVLDGLSRTGLVTITGWPGVGKTVLALAVAGFEEPADSVFLRAVPDGTRLSSAVAIARERDVPAAGEEAAWLAEAAPPSGLWLLDNVEHLSDVASELDSLRAERPDLRILLTSLGPLGARGETVVELRPLQPEHAVRLLRARINTAGPPALEVPDDRLLTDICARVEGLPLAIDLVSQWFTELSPAAVMTALDNGGELVTLGESVRRSLHRLSRGAQALFCGMSMVPAPWTPDLLGSIGDAGTGRHDVITDLADLERSGLIRRERSGPLSRFVMLRPIQDIGRQEFQDQPHEQTATRNRHATYVLTMAKQYAPDLIGAGAGQAANYLEPRAEHLVAALEFWLEQGDARCLTLAGLAWRYWQLRAQYRFGLSMLRRARTVVSAPAPEDDAAAAYGEALFRMQLHLEGASEHALHALDCYRKLDDGQGIGALMSLLGMIDHYSDRFADSRAWFENGLREVPWERARQAHAILLGNYASLLWTLNDAPGAIAAARQAADRHEQLNDIRNLSAQHGNLAQWALWTGDLSVAQEALYRASGGLNEATDLAGLAEVRLVQAEIHLARADHTPELDAGAEEIRAGERLAAANGDEWQLAIGATLAAELMVIERDYAGALDAARQARTQAQALGYRQALARSWTIQSYAQAALNGPQAALDSCTQALEACTDAQLTMITGVAAVVLSAIMAAQASGVAGAEPPDAPAFRRQLKATGRDHPDLPTAAAARTLQALGQSWTAITSGSSIPDAGGSDMTKRSLREMALEAAQWLRDIT